MSSLIEFQGITKEMNGRKVLDNINFGIQKGEVFGILGPNGAGKTTLLRILLGLFRPTSGKLLIDGHETRGFDPELKNSVGVVLDNNGLYSRLTAVENLEFYAKIFGVADYQRKTKELLELVGLQDRAESRTADFSSGMARRLAIARAIVHDPKVVIMDEPLNGLDPEGKIMVRNLMHRLKEKGITILFNSHNLDEVEKVCDRVAVIHHGKLVFLDAIDQVKARFKNQDGHNQSGNWEELFLELTAQGGRNE